MKIKPNRHLRGVSGINKMRKEYGIHYQVMEWSPWKCRVFLTWSNFTSWTPWLNFYDGNQRVHPIQCNTYEDGFGSLLDPQNSPGICGMYEWRNVSPSGNHVRMRDIRRKCWQWTRPVRMSGTHSRHLDKTEKGSVSLFLCEAWIVSIRESNRLKCWLNPSKNTTHKCFSFISIKLPRSQL